LGASSAFLLPKTNVISDEYRGKKGKENKQTMFASLVEDAGHYRPLVISLFTYSCADQAPESAVGMVNKQASSLISSQHISAYTNVGELKI
jgi:hypothetical protein